MDKTAIKNFAIWARNKLIADISYRVGLMGITADGIHAALPQSTGQTEFYDIGTAEPYAITGEAIRQRKHLVERIRQKEKDTDYKTAYKYIIEEVAYTWFNRLIAVRFMEVNDYLPSHIRVLSSDTGKLEPDLVTTPFDAELEFARDEQQTILDLKNANKLDEVFRMLFIKQCNALNEILPALFEKTNDYTELLLNLSVIDQDGVVCHLVHDIPEEDFDVERGGQVEIIGWLYQYYNTEPKNEAFAKSGKISKEEIPAVTQLFTPDWIVRYMVENSVGRLWIEHLRALDESADEAALAAGFGWKYYLPEAAQEPEVEEKLRELRKERASLTPEQITMIDPCMGSGHILVYGFSVLMQIYENAGYGRRDAAKSILEHNLFGLDIDDRAYQMAYFAVMMKAREYNRRILNGENSCRVYSIQESNGITDAALGDMGAILSEENRQKALKEIKALIAEFKDAKEYGSILTIEKRDWGLLRRFAVPNIQTGQLSLDMNGAEAAAERLQEIINIAEVMAKKYYTAVTNPPYMSPSIVDVLNVYVKKNYPDSKGDMFAVFMECCMNYLCNYGYEAMITQHSWMSLATFEKLRGKFSKHSLINMIHLGPRAFDEVSGEMVQSTSFVYQKSYVPALNSRFVRLVEGANGTEKEQLLLESVNVFSTSVERFNSIPGAPLSAYIGGDILPEIYKKGKKISDIGEVRIGMGTGNNDLFLKVWWEVNNLQIDYTIHNCSELMTSSGKYFPYSKGGERKRWYGNHEFVIWYNEEGRERISRTSGHRENGGLERYFHKGMTWSYSTMAAFSTRIMPTGFVFDVNGSSLFMPEEFYNYTLAFLQSSTARFIIDSIKSAFSIQAGTIRNLPIIGESTPEIEALVEDCISISKFDWDMFETSWDFKKMPLVSYTTINNANTSVAESIQGVDEIYAQNHDRLIRDEERLNDIFSETYSLNEKVDSAINEEDITLHYSDHKRDIKALISYAVGCMFGRYSLDVDGLAYAGGTWNASIYESFLPDVDNVIPITDEEYLEDDIVSRLCTWLKVVYGESTLEENIDFIAKALGNKGSSSREIIRNYFLNDFFKDHCQTYSVSGSGKRPIYWLFDSGKQNGFKALIYLHRYNADTIGNLRIDYLHRMQRVYESEISRMQDMIDHSTNAREVGQATKRKDKLTKQLKECREYDEKLAHLALSRIELDLDDGVKVNYRKIQTASDGKFYEVLADSKNIMAKK